VEWATIAGDLAAALRTELGRSPGDRALNSLIGDLAAGNVEFATRWARHIVRFHRSGSKTLHNSLVGDIELTGEGLTLIAYTAEPGSHAQEQLDFLTRWSATGKRPTGPAPANPGTATTMRPEGGSRD
jgi:undecaprenyl pyrophosphate synthase